VDECKPLVNVATAVKSIAKLAKVRRCRLPPGSPQVHPRFTPGSPQVHPRFTPGSPQVHPRFTPGSPQVDRAWFQHLKLRHDEALSSFAFNSNLRRYNAGTPDVALASDKRYAELMELVGR